MKKFYPTLALALTCGVAVAAAPQMPQQKQVSPLAPIAIEQASLKVKPAENLRKKPAKLPTAVEDLYCNYMVLEAKSMVDESGDQWYEYVDGEIVIYQSPDDVNELEIYGLNVFSSDPVYAAVDINAGTITFDASQVVGFYDYGGTPYPLALTAYVPNPANNTGLIPSNEPVVVTITDYGFEFPDDTYMVFELVGLGAIDITTDISCFARPYTLDVEEGWLDSGTVTVRSLYFENVVGLSLQPYQLKAQTKVMTMIDENGVESDHNILRVVNPFGYGTPFQDYNIAICEGALYFDITDPECVGVLRAYYDIVGEYSDGTEIWVEFGYYSGMMDYTDVLYPGNDTGNYIVAGYPYEEIIAEIGSQSTYVDGVITINDPCWGYTFNPQALLPYYYERGDLGTPTLVVDGDLEFNGIESIAPANDGVYTVYNLNGVRVLQTKEQSNLNTLNPGLYIVNGKKVVVR